jgi:hypothetical protein
MCSTIEPATDRAGRDVNVISRRALHLEQDKAILAEAIEL